MEFEIRDARDEDASAGTAVLRRSISELCVADHAHDPAILSKWLENKSPQIFRSWIAQPDKSLLVAVIGSQVIGVGAVTDDGEITLNYVSPDARFRGVSKAMLAALERRAADRGCRSCTLHSTETARRFYLASGYVEQISATANPGYPMSKPLVPVGK